MQHLRGVSIICVKHSFARGISSAGLVRFVSHKWKSTHVVVVSAQNAHTLGAHALGAERNTQCASHKICKRVVAIKSRIQLEVKSTEVFSSNAYDFALFGVFADGHTEVQSGAILKRPFAFDEETVRLTNQVRSVTTKMTTCASSAQHQPSNETNVDFIHTVFKSNKHCSTTATQALLLAMAPHTSSWDKFAHPPPILSGWLVLKHHVMLVQFFSQLPSWGNWLGRCRWLRDLSLDGVAERILTSAASSANRPS